MKQTRLFENDDRSGFAFREVFTPTREGPLPPRPRPSGKGGLLISHAPAHSPQALAYLARTVGGNEGGNATNIATLIDGLVSDGVWAKLDALYVLAQQNATDSLLNLIGTSYTATNPYHAVFTQYVGYSFPATTTIDTGFNAASAPSPKYTQNSASYGAWTTQVIDENQAVMGNGGGGSASILYPSFPPRQFYARLNDGTASYVPTPGTSGLYVGDRSSPTGVVPYWNGVAQSTVGSTSGAPVNANFTIGASQGYFARGESKATAQTLSAAFIGASLGAAGQLALYTRLNTYLAAVTPPPAHSQQALDYLARTVSGNEGGNATNIANLIDGLVADGVWAKLDALYVLAQQNGIDALLNLVGTNYTLSGSTSFGAAPRTPPAFTPYVGFSGFASGITFLDTAFNPTTATSPKYVQNSASLGVWVYAITNTSGVDVGIDASEVNVLASYSNVFYTRINGAAGGIPTPGTKGLYAGDRSSSSSVVQYWNGTSQATPSSASVLIWWLVTYLLGLFPLPPPAPQVIQAILAIILVLFLISVLLSIFNGAEIGIPMLKWR
jgi:hypothetical protein